MMQAYLEICARLNRTASKVKRHLSLTVGVCFINRSDAFSFLAFERSLLRYLTSRPV